MSTTAAPIRTLPLLQRIWSFLTIRQRLVLIGVTLASIVAGFTTTAPAIVIGNIVNSLLGINKTTSLTMLVVELAALLIAFAILNLIVHVSLHSILPRIEVTFRHKQVFHQLRTPIDESEQRYSAEINSIISNGTKGTSDLIKLTFGDLVPACVQAGWAVALAFRQEWIVGLLMLAAAPLGYVLIHFQLKSQSKIRQRIASEKARLDGALTELLQGKSIVRSLYAAESESDRIRIDAQALADAEMQHHRAMGYFDAGKYLTESIFGVAVVLIGIGLAENKSITAGGVLTLYLLYMQFATPLREIHRMRDQTGEVENQCAMMFDLLDSPLDRYFVDGSRGLVADNHQLALSASKISIRYEGQPHPAVDKVSIEVGNGDFIGICGPAGSGKSTVLKSLAGILKVDEGEILVYGQSLDTLHGEALAGVLAYASQSPYLIAASIRDNVTFGLERDATDLEIETVLRAANVWAEVDEMPGGVDQMLGEGGRGVSGGQGQRIVLARLLLRRPRILLLDEATSGMDNLNESAIMGRIEQLGLTIVAIAHRLTTLRNANRIYVMQAGKVVQTGRYDDLASQTGLFKSLLSATDPSQKSEIPQGKWTPNMSPR